MTVLPHYHLVVNYCHAPQKRPELVLNLDCTDVHMSYLIYTFGASNPIHLRYHTMLLIDPVFCCPTGTSCCSAQARRYAIYGNIFVSTLKLPKYLNNKMLVTVGGNLHQNVVNPSRFKTWNCLALHSEKIIMISSKKIPQLRAN